MRNVIPPASSAIETLIHPERPDRGAFTSLFYFLQIGTFRKRRNVRHLSSFLLSVILERIVFSCSASRVHSGSPVRPVSLRARNSLWHLSPSPGMIVQLSVVDPGPFSSKVEPKDCLQNRVLPSISKVQTMKTPHRVTASQPQCWDVGWILSI
jgi:hypothetical protein